MLKITIAIVITTFNRNDLTGLRDAIKNGAKRKDIFEEHPNAAFKYQRGIEAAIQVYAEPRETGFTPKIYIYYGPSGTGKTRRATEEFPDAYIVTEPNGNGTLWWDGYEGQKVVIFDEFLGQRRLNWMNSFCEGRTFKVHRRYRDTLKKDNLPVIVLSNKLPAECYSNLSQDIIDTLLSRFTVITLSQFIRINISPA